MFTRVGLVFSLAILTLSNSLSTEDEWQQWKKQHEKHYSSDIEESQRRAVWFRAYNLVQEHNNEDGSPYQLRINKFADMVNHCLQL